jgi:histone acetyltransferase (RNA polymerase elongator complex component)
MRPLNEEECAEIIKQRMETIGETMRILEVGKPILKHEIIQLRDDAIVLLAAARGLLNNFHKKQSK